MKNFLLVAVLICSGSVVGVEAQRRGAGGAVGSVSFAIAVSDPDGKPIPDVRITVEGAATRTARTEGGRIALENLPAGNYRFRFERDGYLTLERELAARGSAPIDVKVTLTRAPAPPAPPPPPPAPVASPTRPTVNAKPAVVDVPALVEKNWVGRSPSKTLPLSCGSDGPTAVMQLKEAIMPHDHADSDELFYVIAGEGKALIADLSYNVGAGMFMFVPRGTRHALAPHGKNPLIVLASRPGEACK